MHTESVAFSVGYQQIEMFLSLMPKDESNVHTFHVKIDSSNQDGTVFSVRAGAYALIQFSNKVGRFAPEIEMLPF